MPREEEEEIPTDPPRNNVESDHESIGLSSVESLQQDFIQSIERGRENHGNHIETMDNFPEIKRIIDSMNKIEELEIFADFLDMTDDPYIQNRLSGLRNVQHTNQQSMTIPGSSMEGFPELNADAAELKEFADITGIADDPYVQHKLVKLTDEPPSKQPKLNHQYGGQDIEPVKPYVLEKVSEKRFKNVTAVDTKYRVKLDQDYWDGKKLKDIHEDLHGMFDDVLKEATEGTSGNDSGRVLVHHPSLNDAIVIPLQPLEKLDADVIMEGIEKVLQSHQELAITDDFEIDVGIIRVPKGFGRIKITNLHGENNSIHRKKSMIEIVNNDQLCMARAIAVCWARVNKLTTTEWNELTKDDPPHSSRIYKVLKHRKVSPFYYINILNKQNNVQKELAMTLCELANVPTDRPLGLNDIEPFEDLLNVNILVVSSKLGNKFIRITDNTERQNLYLYLVDDEHFHAISSISGFFSTNYFCELCLKPYSNKEKHACANKCIVCKKDGCLETDTQMTCRKCHMTCRSLDCFVRDQQNETVKLKSSSIQIPESSECHKWWKCTVCHKVVKTKARQPKLHECGEYKCNSCDEYVMNDHRCYLRAMPPSNNNDPKFVFFDFECTQDQILQCVEGYLPISDPDCQTCKETILCSKCKSCKNCLQTWCGKTQHVPNFAVAQTVCKKCIKQPVTPQSKCNFCGSRCPFCRDRKLPPCTKCGFREKAFQAMDVQYEFGSWLFSKHFKNFKVVAHNMKGYDGYYLLDYLISQSIRPQKIIYNGSKIMYLHVGKGLNITVIDSLNFLANKLSALPKMFGLKELKKGNFPHFFNVQRNQNYVGPYPDPDYYGAKYMGVKEREEFLQWYDTVKHGVFDFKKEMLEYCRSDVTILREACLKFRDLLFNVTGIDPFDYVTIASVCMGIYKTKFLEETWRVKIRDGDDVSDWLDAKCLDGIFSVYLNGTWVKASELGNKTVEESEFVKSPIAQVPTDDFGHKCNYSQISIQWLESVMYRDNIHIKHALNGGEKQLPGTRYSLDGYCEETNTAYEFHGCVFHRCPVCFPYDRDQVKHPRTQQSMEELYALTLRKKAYIKNLGMKYVCIWEHEFKQQFKADQPLRDYVKSLDIVERLDPRESFFGGRTNACKLHYKVKDIEEIRYVDFTSLYPWVNKYCRYGIGHPEIVTSDFKDISQYFGIAKVKAICPRGFNHPVLLYRSNGKLKFPLCRTCADTENQQPCQCSDVDRAIVGTWCIPELQVAVSKGYEILKIYEIYHWKETTQYDPATGEGGLFANYINTFLKFKQESSGWLDWCQTEKDKRRYLELYFENEGIRLDWEKVEKNAGLRALAKLCLNSFWGKFGQRLNLRQSDFIHESEADKFFQLFSDSTKEMHDFHIVSDDIIQLEWIHKNTFVPVDNNTHIYLATFTTCWARLKLYSILDTVGERALYYDTDSVIYVSRPGEYDPPLGYYLGELTNELDGDDYIVEYVSSGPKSYSYRTKSGKETSKIRGFTLHYANSKLINFDVIKDFVFPTPLISQTLVNPSKICREKRKRKLYNREEQKTFKMVYTKRVVLPNSDTVPYGY